MKIKTNIRAGSGGSATSGLDSSTGVSSGGVNAGGVKSGGKPVPPPVYYSRCVGI